LIISTEAKDIIESLKGAVPSIVILDTASQSFELPKALINALPESVDYFLIVDKPLSIAQFQIDIMNAGYTVPDLIDGFCVNVPKKALRRTQLTPSKLHILR